MALLERDPRAPAAWHGDLPVTSRYTAGLAGERFFRAIKDEGRILGTLCTECDITYVPARFLRALPGRARRVGGRRHHGRGPHLHRAVRGL